MIKIENPVAFSFIMQDEIYLLNNDKTFYSVDAIPEPVQAPLPETPKPDFKYLGKHKKQFLVITHYPETEFMDSSHLTALESTLKRLEFSLDDVAIFNLAAHPDVAFKALGDFFDPKTLLILGKEALPQGIETLQLNKIEKISNCYTLFTYSFGTMMGSTENKKAFWEQMKQL
jgi:hypothetical protein